MKRQLRMGGGIMDVVPRDRALLGGIKKAVKKVAKGVKDIASSDIGKAALIGAAAFGIPGTSIGGIFGRASFMVPAGGAPGVFGLGGIKNLFAANVAKDTVAKEAAKKIGLKETLGIMAGGSLLGALAAGVEAGDEEAIEASRNVDALKTYLRQGYRNLKSFVKEDGSEDEQALEAQVNRDVSEYTAGQGGYAEGGRIGFENGGSYEDFEEFMKERGKAMKEFNRNKILEEFEQYMKRKDTTVEVAEGGRIGFDEGTDEKIKMIKDMLSRGADDDTIMTITGASQAEIDQIKNSKAMGGRMDTPSDNAMQASGIEGLPIRQNPKGVKELDLRKTGGFIPPVGIKEKEDDIPAMLSNNEFVFTADAVRGAGDGDVNLGAQRMYDTMKKLEAGGRA